MKFTNIQDYMLTTIKSATCKGMKAVPVTIEVEITPGIGIHLVGLADTATKESLLRTITAMQSAGYKIPGKKILINIAPADTRKSRSELDLPIAVGIIAASGQMELPLLNRFIIAGKLGLDGSVREIPEATTIAKAADTYEATRVILPSESAHEVAENCKTQILGVNSLNEVLEILSRKEQTKL